MMLLAMKKMILISLLLCVSLCGFPQLVYGEDPDPNYVYEAEATVTLPVAGETPDSTVMVPDSNKKRKIRIYTTHNSWRDSHVFSKISTD